jgi:hypothetical protein
MSAIEAKIQEQFDRWDLEYVESKGRIVTAKIRPRRHSISAPMVKALARTVGRIELFEFEQRLVHFYIDVKDVDEQAYAKAEVAKFAEKVNIEQLLETIRAELGAKKVIIEGEESNWAYIRIRDVNEVFDRHVLEHRKLLSESGASSQK